MKIKQGYIAYLTFLLTGICSYLLIVGRKISKVMLNIQFCTSMNAFILLSANHLVTVVL